MNIRSIWHKTACFTIQTERTNLLIDPFLPLNEEENPLVYQKLLSADAILVTHNHFDHAVLVPRLVKDKPSLKVYATASVLRSLLSLEVPKENLVEIKRTDALQIGDFSIKVYPSKHMKFPNYRLLGLGIRCLKRYKEYKRIMAMNKHFDSARRGGFEIVLFDLEAEGKRVQFLGSLGIESIEYPKNADLLLLAYAGASHPVERAVKILQKLQPKAVVPHHFDNTYPPLTEEMDLVSLKEGILKAGFHYLEPVAETEYLV